MLDFESSVRYIAKLSRKYWKLPYTPSPHTRTTSCSIRIPDHVGKFAAVHETTLTRPCPSSSVVGIRVHSWCHTIYVHFTFHCVKWNYLGTFLLMHGGLTQSNSENQWEKWWLAGTGGERIRRWWSRAPSLRQVKFVFFSFEIYRTVNVVNNIVLCVGKLLEG